VFVRATASGARRDAVRTPDSQDQTYITSKAASTSCDVTAGDAGMPLNSRAFAETDPLDGSACPLSEDPARIRGEAEGQVAVTQNGHEPRLPPRG